MDMKQQLERKRKNLELWKELNNRLKVREDAVCEANLRLRKSWDGGGKESVTNTRQHPCSSVDISYKFQEDIPIDHDVCRYVLHNLTWYLQTHQLLMPEAAPCFEISREAGRERNKTSRAGSHDFKCITYHFSSVDSSDEPKVDFKLSICLISKTQTLLHQ